LRLHEIADLQYRFSDVKKGMSRISGINLYILSAASRPGPFNLSSQPVYYKHHESGDAEYIQMVVDEESFQLKCDYMHLECLPHLGSF